MIASSKSRHVSQLGENGFILWCRANGATGTLQDWFNKYKKHIGMRK